MSKKEVLDNFFNQPKSSKTPISSKTDINLKLEKKVARKIYDDPDKSSFHEEVVEIETKDIYISPYKVDREKLDLSALDNLANNIENVGQLQPCTVRYNPNPNGEESYELIFGERRYKAAILKKLKLKVIVKNLDNISSALQLLAENRNREDNCDYSLYLQISKFLDENILKQKDIVEKSGLTKQKISKIMCFSKIPDEIKSSINDFYNISANTAETIYRLSKNNSNIIPILKIIDKIESGDIGHTKIVKFVENYIKNNEHSNNKIFSSNGRHLFTIRKDNNHNKSIHFPKDIIILFDKKIINECEFFDSFKNIIENKLNSIN